MKSALLFAVASFICRAQSPGSAFEVASVKPSPPMTGNTMTVEMGGDPAQQRYTNVPLRDLIRDAYQVKDYQISGPDWMSSTLFDISARIPEGVSRKQVPVMMQKLLADRFGLKLHREMKQLPVYELVVAKGGIKTQRPDKKDEPQEQPDGTVSMTGSMAASGMVNLTGSEMSTGGIAELISHSTDRPVLDKTDITGEHQFKMHWDAASGASLSNALQDQLGLKLQARTAPLEMLIIDYVAKSPTGN